MQQMLQTVTGRLLLQLLLWRRRLSFVEGSAENRKQPQDVDCA